MTKCKSFKTFVKILLLFQTFFTISDGGHILKFIGYDYLWGPKGSIKIFNSSQNQNVNNSTLAQFEFEPVWNEGKINHIIKGFIINSEPEDACSQINLPFYSPLQTFETNYTNLSTTSILNYETESATEIYDGELSLDLDSKVNNKTVKFFLLVNSINCDFETKFTHANSSGFSGIIIYSQSHRKENVKFENIDSLLNLIHLPLTIEYSSWQNITNENYTYPEYEAEFIDYRSSFFQTIIESLVLAVIILLIPLLILLYRIVFHIYVKIKICRDKKRIEKRLESLHSTISELPIRKWIAELDSFSSQNKSCQICKENFKNDEEIRILPCAHIYHLICIEQWILEERTYCIICKYSLLPPNDYFTPSDISESGDFRPVTLPTPHSEISPLIKYNTNDPTQILTSSSDSSTNKNDLRITVLNNFPSDNSKDVFDASFESVLNRSNNGNKNKHRRKDGGNGARR